MKIDLEEDEYENLHSHVETIIPKEIEMLFKAKGKTVFDLIQIYFGDDSIKKRNKDKYVELMSDMHFVHGIHDTIEVQILNQRHPTYFYIFSYDHGFSMLKTLMDVNEPG